LAVLLGAAFLVLGVPPARGAGDASEGQWVYLRDGQAVTAQEHAVELLAVGDIMPGRGLAGATGLFDGVRETLRSADLTAGNLEGAVSTSAPEDPALDLVLPAGVPAELADAGFDLLSLANNHTLDAGPAGLVGTRDALRAVGLRAVEAPSPLLRVAGGLTFGVVAWNDLAGADRAPLIESIRKARTSADVVVVLVHWGREYARHPLSLQRELADEMLAAGADAVLGAHPHVVQDVEVRPPSADGDTARLIAYSLGNFIFDQGWDDTAQGLALRLLFDARGLRAAQALPLWTGPRPRWMSSDDAAGLFDRILPDKRVGFACAADACRQVGAPEDLRSGQFFSGSIDLTGDGVAEIVRREGETVEVLENGHVVWETPAAWRVRDLALGDPNDDGRFEILLALDQAAPTGEATSHPFVIGYRGGIWRDLWGGSAVHAPILEADLADLDGDGAQELITIEATPDGHGRCLAVWRWHGWGFSLVWRSLPGTYHDLLVLPAEGGPSARLSVAVGD
jgi:poly-gamma-glutamate synthesis protein (capsule biosynthesis protein)